MSCDVAKHRHNASSKSTPLTALTASRAVVQKTRRIRTVDRVILLYFRFKEILQFYNSTTSLWSPAIYSVCDSEDQNYFAHVLWTRLFVKQATEKDRQTGSGGHGWFFSVISPETWTDLDGRVNTGHNAYLIIGKLLQYSAIVWACFSMYQKPFVGRTLSMLLLSVWFLLLSVTVCCACVSLSSKQQRGWWWWK